jgi:two-component system, response regulator FlrC
MTHPVSFKPGQSVLWLDPQAALSDVERMVLAQNGWNVSSIPTLDDLAFQAPHALAVVVRLSHTCERLMEVQRVLQEVDHPLPVFCRVDRDELELAVDASRQGAAGVISAQDWKPQSWARLAQALQTSQAPINTIKTESPSVPTPAAEPPAAKPRNVVFVDPASQHLLALAQRVAQADVTALLVGPTGSGKEVLARVLHESSSRARAPFVALNCAAMPDHLIEDLLFGHERGAFTGAHRDHKGLFEQAQGGTLFLDEIGEMPMHLQSKLLRVLQERQLTRLGGQTTIALNVRVVAATNKDLRLAIAAKEFREDLYYRIATFKMQLLPLAKRPGDIIPLALQVLQQHGPKGIYWQLHPHTQGMLLQYAWPGNVRELENVMRRAMVLCVDGLVMPQHLMFDDWAAVETQREMEPVVMPTPAMPLTTLTPPTPVMPAMPIVPTEIASMEPALPNDLHHAVRLNEHQLIMATIASSPSRQEAAKRLGISPRTLRYKLAQMREMGLPMSPMAQAA